MLSPINKPPPNIPNLASTPLMFSYFFKKKLVNTVAVGIGKGVDQETLQLIAGDVNRVVQVEDFRKLQKKIDTIKSSACSGKLTNQSINQSIN